MKSHEPGRWGSLALLAFLGLLRCSSETQLHRGSESHFFGHCADDADCADGLVCSCERCTRSCDAHADCQGLATAVRCDTTPNCAEQTLGAICAPACTDANDCYDGTKNAWTCVAGECRTFDPVSDAGSQSDAPPGRTDATLRSKDAAPPDAEAQDVSPATDVEAEDASPAIDAEPVVSDAGPKDASAADALTDEAGDAGFPTQFPRCENEACQCEALANCEPAEWQQFLPLGSLGGRVCGRRENRCIITAYSETEGGVTSMRCSLPIPVECPVDLSASNPDCEVVGNCNVLLETCPEDLLSCS